MRKMHEKKSSESRRKLLKSIAAGSGAVVAGKSLPENWTAPIVDSVVLPAHAATTGGDGEPGSGTPPSGSLEFSSLQRRLILILEY